MPRWMGEAQEYASRKGYVVVEEGGTDDCQGCGNLLLRAGDNWAIMDWSYGSCSGCDGREDMSEEERINSFDHIEYPDEQTARAAYKELRSREW